MEGEVNRLRTITLDMIDTVITPEKEADSLTDLQIPSKSNLMLQGKSPFKLRRSNDATVTSKSNLMLGKQLQTRSTAGVYIYW